jgi:hypothetical protein
MCVRRGSGTFRDKRTGRTCCGAQFLVADCMPRTAKRSIDQRVVQGNCYAGNGEGRPIEAVAGAERLRLFEKLGRTGDTQGSSLPLAAPAGKLFGDVSRIWQWRQGATPAAPRQ